MGGGSELKLKQDVYLCSEEISREAPPAQGVNKQNLRV